MLRPEILAPAGDFEKLKFAVLFGADAVYLGVSGLSMRASQGLKQDCLCDAVSFAHSKGVKVYLTCNTLPRNADLECMPAILKAAAQAKIDALIVADLGMMELAKRLASGIAVHISTQAGVTNFETANSLFKLGAKRVVLARELSLAEISEIRAKTPPELEIEAFVHGAMCMAFSGRCLISSFLTGRDANRGQCAQPCRWRYHLLEENRPGEYYELCEEKSGSYILNAKDLCMIEHIPELIAAGVDSFKIEGRAKSFYYTAVVTNAYKQALSLYFKKPSNFILPKFLNLEVQKVSHRRYCTGFFFGQPQQGQFYEDGGYIREFDVVATIECCKEGFVHCVQRNKLNSNTEVEVVSPGKPAQTITIGQLFDEEGKEIEAAPHAMMKFCFKLDQVFEPGSILRCEVAC